MHQQNVEFRNPDLPLDSPLIIENDPKNERPEDERPPMKTDFLWKTIVFTTLFNQNRWIFQLYEVLLVCILLKRRFDNDFPTTFSV